MKKKLNGHTKFDVMGIHRIRIQPSSVATNVIALTNIVSFNIDKYMFWQVNQRHKYIQTTDFTEVQANQVKQN